MTQQRNALKAGGGHTLTMMGRHVLKVTGVDSVTSFDEKEIHLETVEGAFVVVGEDLGIKNLNLEQTQLDIEGTIHVLSYLEGGARARRKKIWEKLFK